VEEGIPIAGWETVRTWISHDGDAAWVIGFDRANPSKMVAAMKTPEVNSVYHDTLTPAQFAGLHAYHSDERMADLLTRPECRMDGTELISGDKCWRIDLGAIKTRGAYLMDLTASFDAAHGFLPRRISVRPSKEDSRFWEDERSGKVASRDNWSVDLEVLEFQNVPDPILGRERWFPRECRFLGNTAEFRIVVDDVAINAAIPNKSFRPELEFGTEVAEGPPRLGEQLRTYIVGGEPALDALMKKRLEEARALNYPVADGKLLLDARDPGGISWSKIIGWSSFAILSAICGMRLFGQRARSKHSGR
jgi:hypothetical protein